MHYVITFKYLSYDLFVSVKRELLILFFLYMLILYGCRMVSQVVVIIFKDSILDRGQPINQKTVCSS